MARLPKPGQDSGTWGNILNDYLSQAHNSDGTLKSIPSSKITDLSSVATSGSYTDLQDKPSIPTAIDASSTQKGTIKLTGDLAGTADNPTVPNAVMKGDLVINVKDYGAKGDGVTDDASAINAAILMATSKGGGSVYLPHGIYGVSSTVVMQDGVTLFSNPGAKRLAIIRELGASLAGSPIVSGPIVSSSDTSTTAAYTGLGLVDIGVEYTGGASRTEYPVLFMNCQQVQLRRVWFGRYSGTAGAKNYVKFGRTTATISGATWAADLTRLKMQHTGIEFDQQTDSFIRYCEINAIQQAAAGYPTIRLASADGILIQGNQIIGTMEIGRNVGLSIQDNYWDGYYLHNDGTRWNGIHIVGPFRKSILKGNRFYQLPGMSIFLDTASYPGATIDSTVINGNIFEDCDAYADGVPDVQIIDTIHSDSLSIVGNMGTREYWWSATGVRSQRTSTDAFTTACFSLQTAGDGGRSAKKVSVVGNTLRGVYGVSALTANVAVSSNTPEALWSDAGWQSFTPILRVGGSNWTPGSAVRTGRVRYTGRRVNLDVRIVIASDTALPSSGQVYCYLPTPARTDGGSFHGIGQLIQGSTYQIVGATIDPSFASYVGFTVGSALMTDTVPATLAGGNVLRFSISYETI